MRDIVRFGIILMIVAGLSAGSLAIVRNATEEKIKKASEEEKREALLEVLPEARVFELVRKERIFYYIGYESKDKRKMVGVAFIAEGKGYSSTIVTMVGITPDGEITGLKILSQKETPNLGANIEEVRCRRTIRDLFRKRVEQGRVDEKPWFQKQFVGKKLEDLHIDKMETVTGATISSRAVIDSVREKIKEILGDQGLQL